MTFALLQGLMGVRMVKLPSTFSHEVHRFNFCRTRTCTGTKSCIWHFLVFSMYLREKIYMCVWLLLGFFFVCECVCVWVCVLWWMSRGRALLKRKIANFAQWQLRFYLFLLVHWPFKGRESMKLQLEVAFVCFECGVVVFYGSLGLDCYFSGVWGWICALSFFSFSFFFFDSRDG